MERQPSRLFAPMRREPAFGEACKAANGDEQAI